MRKILASLRSLARALDLAMCKMNEIQFSAPWKPRRPPCGQAGL